MFSEMLDMSCELAPRDSRRIRARWMRAWLVEGEIDAGVPGAAMKAIVVRELGGPEKLVYGERHLEEIKDNQVLIQTIRSSVNFADIQAVAGKYPTPPMPFVPGLDVFGEIVAVGPGVDQSWLGRRVVAFCDTGGYAHYCLASQGLFFGVNDNIDPDQAGACPLLLGTCYGLLTHASKVGPDTTVRYMPPLEASGPQLSRWRWHWVQQISWASSLAKPSLQSLWTLVRGAWSLRMGPAIPKR